MTSFSDRRLPGGGRLFPPNLSLLVSLLLLSRPASADPLPDQIASVVGLLIVPVTLAALVLLGYLLWTLRRERNRSRLRQDRMKQPARTPKEPSRPGRTPPLLPRIQTGPMLAIVEEQAEKQRSPLPAIAPAMVKVCTVCQREFRSTLTTCPFDRGQLVPASSTAPSHTQDDRLDTQRSLMLCSTCGRQYDLGARFCLFDGKPLTPYQQEEQPDEEVDQLVMVCPRCGAEYDEDSLFCPEDGERLWPEQAELAPPASSVLPVSICPRCLAEYPFTQRACPKDGAELLLLAGRKTGGLPIYGLGQKKMVCPACGARFGADALYCSIDGSKLLSVN
ncbi:MAG: zinc ribbon domain-containing protein [Bradymonadales bacterium]|nr:zinc ribbon domain-containing protein [Bradymonadales bacterium]